MPLQPIRKEELLDAVRSLYAAIERFDAHVAAELGVDRSGLRAINAMERATISPGSLGEALGLSSGSVTALLTRLESAGHIERLPVADDGRRREAVLSAALRAKAHLHYDQLGNAIYAKLGSLDGDGLGQVIASLRILAACFDDKHASRADVVC